MKTGLKKKQKVTEVYFNASDPTAEVYTHDTVLKKRLTAYAAKYSALFKQTDDAEQGALRFEIDKHRISIRLTAPYSKERRDAASWYVKENSTIIPSYGGKYGKVCSSFIRLGYIASSFSPQKLPPHLIAMWLCCAVYAASFSDAKRHLTYRIDASNNFIAFSHISSIWRPLVVILHKPNAFPKEHICG